MPLWCERVQACNALVLLCRQSAASSPRRPAGGTQDSPQAVAAAAQAHADALRLEGEWEQAAAPSEAAQQLQQEADAPGAGPPKSLGEVLEHASSSASDHSHSTGADVSRSECPFVVGRKRQGFAWLAVCEGKQWHLCCTAEDLSDKMCCGCQAAMRTCYLCCCRALFTGHPPLAAGRQWLLALVWKLLHGKQRLPLTGTCCCHGASGTSRQCIIYKAYLQPCMALMALVHKAVPKSQGQGCAAAGSFLPNAHGMSCRAALDITDNAHSTLLLQGLCCRKLLVPSAPVIQLCMAVRTTCSLPVAAAGPFSPDTRRFFQGVKKASQAMAVKQAQRLEAEASGSSIRRAQEEADRCVLFQFLFRCTARPAAACSSSDTPSRSVVISDGAGCRRCVSSCRSSRPVARPGSKGRAQVSRPGLSLSSLPGLRGSRYSCRHLSNTVLR